MAPVPPAALLDAVGEHSCSDASLLAKKQEHTLSWFRQLHDFPGKALFRQVRFARLLLRTAVTGTRRWVRCVQGRELG